MNSTIPSHSLAAVFAAGLLLAGASGVFADQFSQQPTNQHSNITCAPAGGPKEADALSDAEFARAMRSALSSNYHSLVITFGQCFAGGVMDDVAREMEGTGRPVSMTGGAPHDETTLSTTGTNSAGKTTGGCVWPRAHEPSHGGIKNGTNSNPTEAAAFRDATNREPWTSMTSTNVRTAQHKTLNNGGNIKIGGGTNGSGATSYHAILFAGKTDGRPDYYNDLDRQRKMLIAAGYPPGNITVLYGNGTAPPDATTPPGAVPINGPATRSNLQHHINALTNVMNTNEQMYVYIGDHGGRGVGCVTNPPAVTPAPTPGTNNTCALAALQPQDLAILHSPLNTSGPYLLVDVYGPMGISPFYSVYLNGMPVNFGDNQLEPRGTNFVFRFSVDPGQILPDGPNLVSILNPETTEPPIFVNVQLSLGDLGTQTVLFRPRLSWRREPDKVLLSFYALEEMEYLVEWTQQLPGGWLPLQSVIGTGGEVTVEDPLTPDQRFYRVRQGP